MLSSAFYRFWAGYEGIARRLIRNSARNTDRWACRWLFLMTFKQNISEIWAANAFLFPLDAAKLSYKSARSTDRRACFPPLPPTFVHDMVKYEARTPHCWMIMRGKTPEMRAHVRRIICNSARSSRPWACRPPLSTTFAHDMTGIWGANAPFSND